MALVRVPFYFINLLPTSLLYISILLVCARACMRVCVCVNVCVNVCVCVIQGKHEPNGYGFCILIPTCKRRTRRFKISINPSSVSAQSSKPLYVSSIRIHTFHRYTYIRFINSSHTDTRTDLSVYTHTSRHRRVEHIRNPQHVLSICLNPQHA